MSVNVQPLTSITPTPLVREKRHYPGDQKKQQQNKQKEAKSAEPQDEADVEQDELKAEQKKSMDIDEKNVRVKHIDEYA